MNIPLKVKACLAKSGGRFRGRQAEAGDSLEKSAALANIPLRKLIKPVILKSGNAYLMAIIRGDQQLDIPTIDRLFQRNFELCSAAEIAVLMPDCDVQALPPLAEPYGLNVIMDKSVAELEQVYFCSGLNGVFIAANREDFAALQLNTWQAHTIVHTACITPLDSEIRSDMRKQVKQLKELPAMPGMANELIRIRNNPYAHASELAAVIEQDPSLSAQVLRYATSLPCAYHGKIDSVEQAIVRVLGMEFVLDIAFGLSLGRAFNNPKEGPLGLMAFWRHSLHCAALTQALCNAIDYSRRPPAGMGYLAGLLHNFGILLLGHLFPAQFNRLNRALEAKPGHSLIELEQNVISVSHNELGLWLMESWNMPQEIAEAVREHHNPVYQSDFSSYANLVYIANALLKRRGIGDAVGTDIPQYLLDRFGLTEAQLEEALAGVVQGHDGLESMAANMAA